jgi:hypothetical protein
MRCDPRERAYSPASMEFARPEDAIYRCIETPDGPRMLPSPLAGGPWNPQHQHGGPVAGLLTRALEGLDSPSPMRLARITVEMFRGVPLRPLRIESEITRAGRRIQSVEARLFDGELLVARATGLRIRLDDSLPEMFTAEERDPELGDAPVGVPRMREDFELPEVPGFTSAVDIQSDAPVECGVPANLWARLRCRFVEGEEPSPIVRLATLADFASGTGNAMDYTKYTSINPDLTIHVLREPRSDWIGLRGVTRRAADGIGQSASVAHDLDGEVARVQASLLLDRR